MELERQRALQRVIDLHGGVAALAAKLKISRQAIYKWLAQKRVPAERVLEIERLVDGEVTCRELLSDSRVSSPVGVCPRA